MSSDLHAEALSVLEAFRIGWVSLDAAQVLATFCRESTVVVYGTDRGEEWFSHDQLVEPFIAMTRVYQNPVYTWGEGDPTIRPFGDGAWAYGSLNVTLEAGSVRYEFTMRSTLCSSAKVEPSRSSTCIAQSDSRPRPRHTRTRPREARPRCFELFPTGHRRVSA